MCESILFAPLYWATHVGACPVQAGTKETTSLSTIESVCLGSAIVNHRQESVSRLPPSPLLDMCLAL